MANKDFMNKLKKNPTTVSTVKEERKEAPAEKIEKKAPTTNRGQSPQSKKALEKARAERAEKARTKEKKIMQLDVADYEDYLFRMAKYNDMPITKYILHLIEEDQKNNEDTYKGLQSLDKYTKAEKISPNRGKKFKKTEIK